MGIFSPTVPQPIRRCLVGSVLRIRASSVGCFVCAPRELHALWVVSAGSCERCGFRAPSAAFAVGCVCCEFRAPCPACAVGCVYCGLGSPCAACAVDCVCPLWVACLHATSRASSQPTCLATLRPPAESRSGGRPRPPKSALTRTCIGGCRRPGDDLLRRPRSLLPRLHPIVTRTPRNRDAAAF